ncbi:hypothetical protein AB0O64_19030 [Streptomyces sp. NPDC088341]|uniref:hypothetical protein n=1 Tax=Streptomyces sp. NPDC088341 TaxID=3154870 RepID=UPI00342D7535
MRLHTTTVLSLSTLFVLALAGCSNGSSRAVDPIPSASTLPAHPEGWNAPVSASLSSAALGKRLLDEGDLGEGYARKPEQPVRHDDITVSGCPALDKISGNAAASGSLDFPRKAKVSFTYTGGMESEVAEELYSDTEDKLSKGVGRIFEAMTSCPTYQMLVGSTPSRSGPRRCLPCGWATSGGACC